MRNLIIICSLLAGSLAQATGPSFLPKEAIQNTTSATSLVKDKPWYWARVGVPVGIHAISLVSYAIVASQEKDARAPKWLILGTLVPLVGLASGGYAHWQYNQIKALQSQKLLNGKNQPNQTLAFAMMGLTSLAGLGAAGLWRQTLIEDNKGVLSGLYDTWIVSWKDLLQGELNLKSDLTFTWTSHLSIPLNIWTAIVIYKQNNELKRLAAARA